MNKYSPISRLIIKDFRNIQDIQIDFGESPIIALVGGNDVGKTSILKAFEVCALHHNSRAQKGYIRTGAPFFGVGIQLADGTSIVRIKTKDNINKYEVRYPDGTAWTTTKISEGLPVQVKEVMGMVEEPETKEYLQVRTYEDQLLLVYTPASTNYKVMYDALKVGQITRAVRNGTDESNSIKQKIIENSVSIRTLEDNIRKIKVMDLEGLLQIREAIRGTKEKLQKISEALDIIEKINYTVDKLGVLRLIETYKLKEESEVLADKINSANTLYKSLCKTANELDKVNIASNLETIDIVPLEKLRSTVNNLQSMHDIGVELEKYGEIESTNDIAESTVIRLNTAMNSYRNIAKLDGDIDIYSNITVLNDTSAEISIYEKLGRAISRSKEILDIGNELEVVSSNITELSDKLKESGARVEQCPNCGTDVIIEA